MEIRCAFEIAARWNGFVEVNKADDGSAVWFRNELPDMKSSVHKRLSIDSLTNSATIYWETPEAEVNSKTFCSVSSLEDWLGLHPSNRKS
jgi:hypothetical protein